MIINLTQLSEIRKKYKNKRIVFAAGVFDMFHTTHIKAFKQLRSYGDIVVIGIVSDKRVKERKGPLRPILNEKERREIVDAIKYVDYVVQMPNPTKKVPVPTVTIFENLKPNIFVTVDTKWIDYKEVITSLGIQLKIVKRIHPTSSTSIIDRVLHKYNGKNNK